MTDSGSPTDLLDVLASYAELRREYMKDMHISEIPQLLVLSYSSLDNYNTTSICHHLQTRFMDIQDDMIFVRSGIADQTRNALTSAARVVLHLSTQPNFGVQISEALHKGVPTIATRMEGMSTRIDHGKSGFLVESGDHKAVARYLHYLFTNHKAYDDMARHAATHVSDDLSTVGNALAWLYLADALSQKEGIEPSHMCINDMARKASGFPHQNDES
jgi:glycosyltransferase involved in cell wall biosynthesis